MTPLRDLSPEERERITSVVWAPQNPRSPTCDTRGGDVMDRITTLDLLATEQQQRIAALAPPNSPAAASSPGRASTVCAVSAVHRGRGWWTAPAW